jgi:hypothetical protein
LSTATPLGVTPGIEMKAGNRGAGQAALAPPDALICVTSTNTPAAAANAVMTIFRLLITIKSSFIC